uniref:hAT-like transposase RNase-H fold domain-containing protein n=1 Tax=Chenopodium quinoa TaxID=63459 RepID=A0A803MEM4_CHEQI
MHISGSLYVTSNLFFHELVSVSILLNDLVSSDDPDMCLMACRMKDKYEKYWGDPEKINLLIFIAVVLDPRYKLDYVEWMINEIYNSIVASKLVKNVKEAMNALYEDYCVSSYGDGNKVETASSSDDKIPMSPKHKKIEVLKNKYKKHKCLVCAQNWLRAAPFPSIEECLEEVEHLEEEMKNMAIGDAKIDEVVEILE